MKKMNRKGFTLAELLIVVAIIAVLVAVAIPVFSAQLEKSRDATTVANLRSAYAEATTAYLTDDSSPANITSITKDATAKTVTVIVTGVRYMDTDGDISSASDGITFTVTGMAANNSQKDATVSFVFNTDDGSVEATITAYA